MAATLYPTLRVKAGSQNKIGTDGHNDVTGGNGITDLTGVVLTNASASCFVSVVSANKTATVTRAAMTYVSSGLWTYTLPASALVTNAGPWTITVEVFDQTGVSGTLLRTFYTTGMEVD